MTPTRLTTAEAAALANMTTDAFRKAMQRERFKGRDYRLPADQWYPGNNPAWDARAVQRWVAGKETT